MNSVRHLGLNLGGADRRLGSQAEMEGIKEGTKPLRHPPLRSPLFCLSEAQKRRNRGYKSIAADAALLRPLFEN